MAGHQIFGPDSIGDLTKTGALTASLSNSEVTVGGLQHTTGTILLDLSTSGFGGLDTGSMAASTLYYIHAVVSSGNIGLVASVNASLPTGFTSSKKIGEMISDSSSQMTDPAIVGDELIHEYTIMQFGNALTNRTDEIEYNLATATITDLGGGVIAVTDDSGNTRTKYIANKKCTVDIAGSANCTAARAICILKNDVIHAGGSVPSSSGYVSFVSSMVSLEEGEFFTITSMNSAGLPNTGNSVDNGASETFLSFTAKAKVRK